MTSAVLPLTTLSSAGNTQLLLAALAGIATVVLLIVLAKFHPLLGLMLGTAVLALVAWVPPEAALQSFLTGVGTTFGSVGLLIALGAMIGKLLADSGGANAIVDAIIGRVGRRGLPWAMALIAALIGLPMFFEIGVVILVPIVVLVAIRTKAPLMLVGIPALAGLSILHGLVPPHPGPLTAITLLHASLGITLLFGLITAVPTLIISGPLLAYGLNRWVPAEVPAAIAARVSGSSPEKQDEAADEAVDEEGSDKHTAAYAGKYSGKGADKYSGKGADVDAGRESARDADDSSEATAARAPGVVRQPPFVMALLCLLLPIAMMLARAIGEVALPESSRLRGDLFFIGEPTVALLVGVLVAMLAVGHTSGMNRRQINDSAGSGLPAVASIMLIVAAGGGFKQVLSDSGVANVIADAANGSHLSVLFLGWLVAVGIRLATGSATVATVTAAGIVGPLGAGLSTNHLALLVLAIGAGSLFFSHVNDAGFWLVKEYFGLTVGETIRSWSVMETVISVVALGCVLLLSLVF
jgi:gluconate:H+ symporter, GntP family